jgi:hypothetical protein
VVRHVYERKQRPPISPAPSAFFTTFFTPRTNRVPASNPTDTKSAGGDTEHHKFSNVSALVYFLHESTTLYRGFSFFFLRRDAL